MEGMREAQRWKMGHHLSSEKQWYLGQYIKCMVYASSTTTPPVLLPYPFLISLEPLDPQKILF